MISTTDLINSRIYFSHKDEYKFKSYNKQNQCSNMLLYVYVMESTLAEFFMYLNEHYISSLSAAQKDFFYSCKSIKMKEKTYRSVLKTISWRTIGTIDTILISYLVIGDLKWAMSIGGVELFTKMGLYFIHERTWNKIQLGKEKEHPIDYHI